MNLIDLSKEILIKIIEDYKLKVDSLEKYIEQHNEAPAEAELPGAAQEAESVKQVLIDYLGTLEIGKVVPMPKHIIEKKWKGSISVGLKISRTAGAGGKAGKAIVLKSGGDKLGQFALSYAGWTYSKSLNPDEKKKWVKADLAVKPIVKPITLINPSNSWRLQAWGGCKNGKSQSTNKSMIMEHFYEKGIHLIDLVKILLSNKILLCCLLQK